MVTNAENKNTNCQLWDAKTFGQRLSLSKRQIFRLNSCGKIPASVKIGGAVRWRLSDIELWLEWECPCRKTFESMLQMGDNYVE
jgi:prophage regulatory protein